MKKKFGATIICRDNEDIIERMLDSIVGDVDEICICDTGSKDNTLEIIQNYKEKLENIGKRLIVFQDEWKNFGHNRTLSMKHARELNVEYFMIIDTDETATFNKNFFDNILKNNYDYYDYIVESNNLRYNRYGVFKNDRDWQWEGYAHNQVIFGNATRSVTEDIIIHLHPHTAYSGDHNKRSINLLEQEIKDNKQLGKPIERPAFFLAQLYNDAQRNEEAINLFNLVLQKCDNNFCGTNVGYYSNYKSGELLLYTKDEAIGIKRLLRAYELQPYRAEPLYILGKFYREKNNYNSSELFLRKAMSIPEPKYGFFIKPDVYRYLIKFELSITLFYLGKKNESLELMKEIDRMDNVATAIQIQNQANQKYF